MRGKYIEKTEDVNITVKVGVFFNSPTRCRLTKLIGMLQINPGDAFKTKKQTKYNNRVFGE